MMQKNQNCTSTFPTTTITNEALKKIFTLLAEGETKQCNQPKVENATLILGNTGVGKTVFTRRIAGYGATLKSVEEGLDYSIVNPNEESDSKSFITSNTVYPELVQDNSTSATFYDFPGFLDTRGAANDITTTYFIKKTVDNVKRIKLLLLINHTSLSNDGTRDDFITLLSHATKFIKNIEKFKDGIALIATKVQYPEKSDESIVSTIAEFIKKAKTELQQKSTDSADFSNVIKLIDIILQQDGNTYPIIGISRSPDQKGLLNEIPVVQENTTKIKAMLAKLKFVDKIDTDFGYIIPKKSLVDIGNIINEIHQSIAASVREIAKKISHQEGPLNDITTQYEARVKKHDELRKLKENANNQSQVEKCVQELINGIAPEYTSILKYYRDYLTFLHDVSDHTINTQFKCADGLQEAIDYHNKGKMFSHFLNKLHERLSDYEIQRDTQNSPCIEFAGNVARDLDKQSSEFKLDPLVVKKCYPNYESEFEDIRNLKIDKNELELVSKMLNLALRSNLSYSCDSNKLVIKGQYVKLGDIPNIQNRECRTPRCIDIFALNKIFIDVNLDKTGEEVQLSIIAPVWDIQGVRRINLEGEPGKPHNPSKAPDGSNPGDRGADGIPGLPGGRGGNFLGIGEVFKNVQGLAISVKGGRGGPGQNGGDGKMGRNGDDAYNDVYVDNDGGGGCSAKSRNHGIKSSENVRYRRVKVVLAGKEGQKGGDGGDGGTGGIGGNSGDIAIVSLDSSNTAEVGVHKVIEKGSKGSDGRGGEGGAGGKYGNNLEVSVPLCFKTYRRTKLNTINEDRRTSWGNRGRDGYIARETPQPKSSEKISRIVDVINECKRYVNENRHNSVKETHLLEFHRKLELSVSQPGLVKYYARKRRDINDSDQTQNFDHKRILMTNNIKSSQTLEPTNSKTTNETIHLRADDSIFAKSSGVRMNSPINSAISLISNFFGQWKLFSAASVMNYRLIKGSLEYMFRDSKPSGILIDAAGNTGRAMKLNDLNINESLVLADFAIRCVTKQKFYNNQEKSLDSSEIRASVLNIITEFENILTAVSAEYNLPPESLDFDPVILISKLEKEIANKNYKQVGKILYQSIDSGVYRLWDNPQFHTRMLHELEKILERQTEGNFQKYYTENGYPKARNASKVIEMGLQNDPNMQYQLKGLEVNRTHSIEQMGFYNLK